MKYSLLTLVLAVLLAALLTNLFLIRSKTQKSISNAQEYSAELEQIQLTLEYRSQQDMSATVKSLKSEMQELTTVQQKLFNAFEEFSSREGRLTTSPEVFSIKEVPLYPKQNKFERTFVVYVPENFDLAMKVVFRDANRNNQIVNHFLNANDFLMELPTGESTLSFSMEQAESDSGNHDNIISVAVDGIEQKSWTVRGKRSWYGFGHTSATYRDQLDCREAKLLYLLTNYTPSQSDKTLDWKITPNN